jgi:hypothetical protein
LSRSSDISRLSIFDPKKRNGTDKQVDLKKEICVARMMQLLKSKGLDYAFKKDFSLSRIAICESMKTLLYLDQPPSV